MPKMTLPNLLRALLRRRINHRLRINLALVLLPLWFLQLVTATTGFSTANLANKWLDTLSNTSFAAGTQLFAKLHTGDPGASGTANASQFTTRQGLTWSAAASGSKAITSTLPSWTMSGLTSPTTESISYISVWDASSAGNFLYSFALTAAKSVANGDVFNLTSHTFSLSPLAA